MSFKPSRHDIPIFSQQRHAVGNSGKRTKIEQIISVFPQKRHGELKRNACAAQVVVGIIVFEFGIDDDAVGQAFGQFVVIGHDDESSLFLDILHFFRIGDTAALP